MSSLTSTAALYLAALESIPGVAVQIEDDTYPVMVCVRRHGRPAWFPGPNVERALGQALRVVSRDPAEVES